MHWIVVRASKIGKELDTSQPTEKTNSPQVAMNYITWYLDHPFCMGIAGDKS